MKRVGAVLLSGAVFFAQVSPAYACGPGLAYLAEHENDPEYYSLTEVFNPPEHFAWALKNEGVDEEFTMPEELRFDYPFQFAPELGAARWEALRGRGFAYDELPEDSVLVQNAAADLKPFLEALGKNDRAAARAAAQKAVDDVLDMPAVLAQEHALTLKRAIEYLELEPGLSGVPAPVLARYFSPEGTPANPPPALAEAGRIRGLERAKAGAFAQSTKSPRKPSLEFVGLQERLKQALPDGWSASSQPAPEVVRAVQPLRQAQQAWLAAYPQHPLADLVRLFGVRLNLALGDIDGAWKAALAVYPRHRMRAVGEWRYLIYLGLMPKDLAPFRADPYLRVALVLPGDSLTPEEWSKEWAYATAHADEPWSDNYQERLLYVLVDDLESGGKNPRTLPKGFPAPTVRPPTSFWQHFQLAGYLVAHRYEDAAKALQPITDPSPPFPNLRASLALALGRPQEAARVKGLDEHALAYLLRVRLSDADLQALAQGPDASLATEAAEVLAERRIAQGDWSGAAAALRARSPEQAKRYEELGRLASDGTPAGQLALARALRDQAKELLPLGEDVQWYRSVATLIDPAAKEPMRAAETEPLRVILLAGNARVLSLQAFGRYLAASTDVAEGKRALKEADGVYNSLINWDKPTTTFYRDVLKDSEAAKAIRAAGVRLKKAK